MSEKTIILRCQKCNSSKIYSVEFRTDYARPRKFCRVNDDEFYREDDFENNDFKNYEDEIEHDKPYYMSGHYCLTCDLFCNTYEDNKVGGQT